MQMAAGTVCTPAGLTYDFKVQASSTGTFTGGASGVSGGRSLDLGYVWVLAAVCAGLGTVL
jgi:hypothetical protein